MLRGILTLAGLALLGAAILHIPGAGGWQAAVPLSREGHENITFWVNHDGLQQIDVLGEVGFGDMARILMRRRANSEKIRGLRDRFTFSNQKMEALDTPDVFQVEITSAGLVWRRKPASFIIGADQTFNLPLIVHNLGAQSRPLEARFEGTTAQSSFAPVDIPSKQASGFFLRAVESQPGAAKGRVIIRSGSDELQADVAFDVRPLARLRVRLLDEKGLPTAGRIYLTASDGLAYAPAGFINRYTAMSAEPYFHAEGSFEIGLPAGPTLIEAARGIEYELTSEAVELSAAKLTEIPIRLKRWVNMASKGWYSSDAHIHANYTAPHHQLISPHDVRLQAIAEDLNNANMMVANSGGAFIHDAQHFEGKPHALSSENYSIYWNEEMRNSGMYGHMSFFNLKELVHPLYTGFRDTPHWEDYPANYTQAEGAQRQGGAVTYVHPTMEPTFEATSSRELPVDLALGQVDALDVLANTDETASMQLWYRLLNCGFRLSISAGTDSFTNVADHYTAGGGRVYVYAPKGPQSEEWVHHYKQGRSFASNSPVMSFKVNGKGPGEELELSGGSVRIKATVSTLVPLEKVEVVVNGQPVISRSVNGEREIVIDETAPIRRSSWIALRAVGPWHRLILNDVQAFAHSSPVYVSVGGRKIAHAEDARFYIDWIERLIARVERRGRFSTSARKQEVIDLCRRALQVYRDIEREGVAD
ncbi:MAG: CehA/McbA family metallohydrolase [Bryobacteraceae bacterium]